MPNTDHAARFFAQRRRLVAGHRCRAENANIIRDAEVTDAVTQKNFATTQMKSNASAQSWLIDSAHIHGTEERGR